MLTRLGGPIGVLVLASVVVVAASGRWVPAAALALGLLVAAFVQGRRRSLARSLHALLAPAGGGFWRGRVVAGPVGLLGAGRAPGRWLWAGVPTDLLATSEHVALSVRRTGRRLAGYTSRQLTWADVVTASGEHDDLAVRRPRPTTSTYVTLVLVPGAGPDDGAAAQDGRPAVLTFLTDDATGLVEAVRRSATGALTPPPRP